eukprot:10497614-Alexandrium_andersonii.AAC.1
MPAGAPALWHAGSKLLDKACAPEPSGLACSCACLAPLFGHQLAPGLISDFISGIEWVPNEGRGYGTPRGVPAAVLG